VFSAHRLRGWRHSTDLSHAELATRAHTTAATIAGVEAGDITPHPRLVAALAAALGATVAQLCTDDPHRGNGDYWRAVAAAAPAPSTAQIDALATILDRIQQRHNNS
jgi:transcriptional regulator with XRE-family HTH domain